MAKEMKRRKVERYDTEITDAIAENYKEIINNLEDVNREGMNAG
jgi:GTP cyclohydrolase I